MAKSNLAEHFDDAPLPFVLPTDIAAYNASLVPEVLPTMATTIAGVDVALPLKFFPGMIFTDVTTKIADAHCQRQFANNRNAAFNAWEKKAKAWDESTASDKGDRPVNPCTAEKLLADYVDYLPKVGESGQTSLEKLRLEAGLIVYRELIVEHNAAVDAKDAGAMVKAFPAGVKVSEKKGKGAAEHRDQWVQKVLNTKNAALIERVQTTIDRLVADSKATQPEGNSVEAVANTEVDF